MGEVNLGWGGLIVSGIVLGFQTAVLAIKNAVTRKPKPPKPQDPPKY